MVPWVVTRLLPSGPIGTTLCLIGGTQLLNEPKKNFNEIVKVNCERTLLSLSSFFSQPWLPFSLGSGLQGPWRGWISLLFSRVSHPLVNNLLSCGCCAGNTWQPVALDFCSKQTKQLASLALEYPSSLASFPFFSLPFSSLTLKGFFCTSEPDQVLTQLPGVNLPSGAPSLHPPGGSSFFASAP